jgi:hypothetical protein
MKLIPFFKSELIEFYCLEQYYDVIEKPVPAYKMMPDWFKRMSPTVDDKSKRDSFGSEIFTAKKCMPLLDAMSAGFIIPLGGDVNVRVNDKGSLIEATSGPFAKFAEFHDKEQLGGKMSPTYPGPAVKFINYWVVKTAPGYSALFIPPINHIEPRFTCLGGLVDTDRYSKEVNFPAIWHMKNFDGVLKAGTPLVTCIPVKRADLPRQAPVRVMSEKERKYIDLLRRKQDTKRSVYTDDLREPRK